MITLDDTCPCGSGLKFGDCCYKRMQRRSASGISSEVGELLKGKNFASLEEANRFLGSYMEQRNSAPLDDFCGLSPAQMHKLLDLPFESPELAEFPVDLGESIDAPVMQLFNHLAEAIGEDGLKATATGNLPQKFVKATFANYDTERYPLLSPRIEPEYQELHTCRILAEMSGFIRRYKGKYVLIKRCRDLLAKGRQGEIYQALLKTCVTEFNWAYNDAMAEIPTIRRTWLYTLYLLYRNGSEFRPQKFYEGAFLRAFPLVMKEIARERAYGTPEEYIRHAYTLRTIERFAVFFGLAEAKKLPGEKFRAPIVVKGTELLERAVVLHV
ncbi:MAG: SEC-C domain-containing protein [Capsulimonadaceae bacterium]|nr:SEC-C domain-containing protein [Capsulimonadaceae bacterium]